MKTYAQIAAAATPTTTMPQKTPPRQHQLTQVRKERAPYEVTLSARGANSATKDKLAKDSHKVITENLQRAIDMADLPIKPAIKSVNKMSKNTLRLYFKTPNDANLIRNTTIDWNIAYGGLGMHRPKYGIIVHGVPMEAINLSSDYTTTIQDWEEQNKGLKISNVAPLKRHPKHTPAANHSLIIFTHDRDAANKSLSQGDFSLTTAVIANSKSTPHISISTNVSNVTATGTEQLNATPTPSAVTAPMKDTQQNNAPTQMALRSALIAMESMRHGIGSAQRGRMKLHG